MVILLIKLIMVAFKIESPKHDMEIFPSFLNLTKLTEFRLKNGIMKPNHFALADQVKST